jgi:ATP-binding protein involved in chromosome partitioning
MTTSTPQPSQATDEAIRAVLRGVIDPELHVNIVELGMVRDIAIDATGTVTIGIALTTIGCPLRAEISRDVKTRVQALPGVSDVAVTYSEMTSDEKRTLMQRARLEARERAPQTEVSATTRVLAIASGKGGVGKSSVTVNLAAALARRGYRVGVLDADIWGFSVPRMLGVSGRLRGEDGKIHPNVVTIPNADAGAPEGSCHVVSMGFLVESPDTALMWRGLILAKAVEQFLTDVRWGELDYLLIDLPPGTGDIQMALARLLPQAHMIVVTTPSLAAQEVAARVADMAQRSSMHVAGVIENMSVFVAPDGSEHAIFGSGGGEAFAEHVGAPLLGRIPIEPAVANGGDAGKPAVISAPSSLAAQAFSHIAARIVDDIAPPISMAGCTARMMAAIDAAANASASQSPADAS